MLVTAFDREGLDGREDLLTQISGLGASATVTIAETESFALAWAEQA